MERDRAVALLPRLIDDALWPFTRLAHGAPFAGCAACAGKLEELRAMQAAIRTNLPYHRAPPGLAQRIGNVLPREMHRAPVRPWFRMPAFGWPARGSPARWPVWR